MFAAVSAAKRPKRRADALIGTFFASQKAL
jgi:hypothetical protein